MTDDNNNEQKSIEVNIPDSWKSPQYSNTFRVGFTDSEFLIDFGLWNQDDNEGDQAKRVRVDVVSRITLSANRAMPLIQALLQAVHDFQQEYKVDLGLKEADEGQSAATEDNESLE